MLVESPGRRRPMRVWPGLRFVGAGGKAQKGVFVTVSEVGERVSLESRGAELRVSGAAEADPALQCHHLRLGAGAPCKAASGSATWIRPISL